MYFCFVDSQGIQENGIIGLKIKNVFIRVIILSCIKLWYTNGHMIDVLEKIFGSVSRVKTMRLFLCSPQTPFDIDDIIERTREKAPVLKKEIGQLVKSGFLKKKNFSKEVVVPSRSKKKNAPVTHKTKKVDGWVLSSDFPLTRQLRSLLIDTQLIDHNSLGKRLQNGGKLKLVVLSGVFLQDGERGVDMLLVGDRVQKNIFERAVREVESEIGSEIRYALFTQEEFMYRMDMYDKLIRDVFDFPHHVVVNSLSVEL